ncbi:PucR family transcriptional regulator [Bacillus alkalicellulosilyticus]|uniref:PucR family transcriptional regulator n=1 Tax=Alkalihalobacterium alkalicellulosilyticum TaxID=1912214 RepID=UPI000997622D|nr:PucR family transcriptional regulator [Bacillus alkalicellulosilyticus]
MKSFITVEEIMKRKHFEEIELVAGEKGLSKQVKWVHVVEVSQIKNLLNGNELILTTGLGWHQNKQLFLSFVTQLIECGVAGLCIEKGTYMNVIPIDVVHLANQYQFPIILFLKEVPFVEITQDIHALLINTQYQNISNLETYSQQLNRKLLTIEDHEEIILFLHEYLAIDVVFLKAKVHVVSNVKGKQRQQLIEKITNRKEEDKEQVASQEVQLLGKVYGELFLIGKKPLTDFDLLILDRTVTALSQLILRDLYVEEKKQAQEIEWMNTWIEGEHTEEEIGEYLSYHGTGTKVNGGVVCLCSKHPGASVNSMDKPFFNRYFRTLLEQQGFYLFLTEKEHYAIYVIINQRSIENWKQRLSTVIEKIKSEENHSILKFSTLTYGVGKYVIELKKIDQSYQTAKEVLRLQHTLSSENVSFFYDDLHLYRMIAIMNKHSQLDELVMEYLEPVIQYDKKHNGELVTTLKTYLSCNGSKQETAKQLFIVRQTLYHRLEKLEKLLGTDFMQQNKRLALELMLLAQEYLEATSVYKQEQPKLDKTSI